ncbi:type IIA DNA topoisomerase subunit B [bacterium]|nr:type IIA DNA topoisomerase subunit B [bacterium]
MSRKPSAGKTSTEEYSAKDIQVLSGLEPVRKRPAMYIGGVDKAGLHHLVWEIVDNSIDEVMNGHADQIEVEVEADCQGVRIGDNGRGIPVDMHEQFKKPALELILTTLHAGGKFSPGNYQYSGGLHGVGASVVNALSENLEARVRRGGKQYRQRFERGHAVTPLEVLGDARGTGTSIAFRPDSEIFADCTFDPQVIVERLEAKSYLHRVKITLKTARDGRVWKFDHGLGIDGYLQRLIAHEQRNPGYEQSFVLQREQDPRMEVAVVWVEEGDEKVWSYVNGIPTAQGGTHDLGLRAGIVRALRNYMETHNLTPKNLKLSAEDLRDGMRCVLSVYVPEPQFKGQTKERLNNPEVQNQVANALAPSLEQFLNANSKQAEALVERLLNAARQRVAQREAIDLVTRKTATTRLNLPGKLADCSSNRPSECELFVVEGDSAGGSAKQARDRKNQAVLPLRGKVLNTEQANLSKIQQNKEILNLISAIGCGVGSKVDVSRLRYHRVVILTDADSDGHHIAGLLITFFYRYLPDLIRQGHIYLGRPPLYRIRNAKVTQWAWSDKEKDRMLKTQRGKPEITRFKGLGEMSPQQLKETTLDPASRTLYRVRLIDEEAADQAVRDCFGKDPAPRFQLVMEHAREVEAQDA